MSLHSQVILLYEDRFGPRNGFGLHKFVVSCVFDKIDGDRANIEHLLSDFRPMKNNSSLLRSCRDDFEDLCINGQTVFAVFDNDRVRELLQLPGDALADTVIDNIKADCRFPDKLEVILLEQNTESVIQQIHDCDQDFLPEIVKLALEKDLTHRDAILVSASYVRNRDLRRCVLDSNVSLRRFIDRLCALATCHTSTGGLSSI